MRYPNGLTYTITKDVKMVDYSNDEETFVLKKGTRVKTCDVKLYGSYRVETLEETITTKAGMTLAGLTKDMLAVDRRELAAKVLEIATQPKKTINRREREILKFASEIVAGFSSNMWGI